MAFSFSSLSYKQKSLIAEISYLVFIAVLSPFAVGLQIFSKLSFTLSLVLINILQLPVIVLFYRAYLPYTIGKKRYFLAGLLFPIYIILYDLNGRLSTLTVSALPFIPQGYRNNLKSAHAEDFTTGYFNQSIGYTCLVLLAATSIYVIKLLFKNQHNLFVLKHEKLKMELSHLKSQVQPHFFFNTLNNLYALSVQGSPKASPMIADLSDIMRYVLYNSENDKVPLQQEVDFIKSYIELENLRHDNKEVIEFSAQGTFDNIYIEPLIFLPLIENTFKHSLQKNTTEKWVKLVLSADEDEIVFQTSNPKSDNTVTVNTGGIGLKNVRKRLKLLYSNKHQLELHDEDGVFTAILTIVLK